MADSWRRAKRHRVRTDITNLRDLTPRQKMNAVEAQPLSLDAIDADLAARYGVVMDLDETAQALRASRRSAQRAVKSGELQRVNLGGGRAKTTVTRRSVAAFIFRRLASAAA